MSSLNLRAALKRNPNRPTLKQRAAALKATAARVMRRRAPALTPEAGAPVGLPDPIFAAIETNREAESAIDTFSREHRGQGCSAEALARQEVLIATQLRSQVPAFATRPTTADGRKALCAWIRWQLDRHAEPEKGDGTVWADACLSLLAVVEGLGDAPIKQGAVPAAVLSKCSVHQLARLYETLAARWHLSSTSMDSPFLSDNDSYNTAGRFLDKECDRLWTMMEEIVREIASRDAKSEEEHDDQLAMQVRHQIECNGSIYAPTLLATINSAWSK